MKCCKNMINYLKPNLKDDLLSDTLPKKSTIFKLPLFKLIKQKILNV